MTITRVKPANWASNELLSSAQMNSVDTNVTNALDKRAGQTDTLASVVSLTGAGRVIKTTVQGANANTTYTADGGNMAIVLGVAITANRTYTLSATNAVVGDEITIYCDAGFALPLSANVAVTNGSAAITFSIAQTIANGATLTFASQPGVFYYLAASVTASTVGTLTGPYTGTTNAATTGTVGLEVTVNNQAAARMFTIGTLPSSDGNYATFVYSPIAGAGGMAGWALETNSGPKIRTQQYSAGTNTFNVPLGVPQVFVEGYGGGGGGGGGSIGATSAGPSAGGGAGGGGARKWSSVAPVAPGGTATISVGAAGSAGSASSGGGNGGNSVFTGLTVLTFLGAMGGPAGTTFSSSSVFSTAAADVAGNTINPLGAVPVSTLPAQWGAYGSNCVAAPTTTNGISGQNSPQGFTGGVGGVVSAVTGSGYLSGGGGGGGGAGPNGNGGNGGTSGGGNSTGVIIVSSQPGSAAAANSGAGGGGGGGGGSASSGAGGAGAIGGAGGSGFVTVSWVR